MNIPATWMRGGTSKGLFLLDADLPQDESQRFALLARLLGSPDSFERQTDGLGGATSSTSKVVVLKKSTQAGHDVDFWFAQVDIKSGKLDASGNCGNLSAAVGPFAIWAGLVKSSTPMTSVRIYQQNIGQTIVAHVLCDANGPLEHGSFHEDGVPFDGAPVQLEFLEQTGQGAVARMLLLPTAKVIEKLQLPAGREIDATLITAGNPTVFVRAADLGLLGTESAERVNSDFVLLAALEHLRAQAAVRMGLAASMDEASRERPAVPKIAWVSAPRDNPCAGGTIAAAQLDVCARILSMNKLHHAFTGTGAIALACAARLPGSVVHEALRPTAGERVLAMTTAIGHHSGVLRVAASVSQHAGVWRMDKTLLERSARRLMSGAVHLPDAAASQSGCC